MDPQNNEPQDNPTPKDLPILDDRKVETHTMQEDLQKASPEESEDQEQTPKETADSPEPQIPTPPTPPLIPQKQETKKSIFDKFRKPKGIEPTAPDIPKLKKMMPKLSAVEGSPEKEERQEPTSDISDQKPKISASEKKLDIKIPGKKSRLSMIIIFTVILTIVAAGAGFGYYWFFAKEAPKETTNKPTQEQPEVIEVPKPVVKEPKIKKPIKEVVSIGIPEPKIPQTNIDFAQTIITTADKKDKSEFIKNLRADSKSIAGDGTITRHLFKISNDNEKRFLTNKELMSTLGISIPNDVWPYINNIEFISYKVGNSIRYGFIAKTTNENALKENMKKWGTKMIQDLTQLFMGEPITIPENPAFSKNSYLTFKKRYINLTSPEISLDYAISKDYLIVATSKDMMFASILQVQK